LRRLLPLIAIVVFVWAILLLSALLISKIAFSITFGTRTTFEILATQIARNGFSAMIILIWLIVWKKVTDFYLWRKLTPKGATA